MAGTVYRPAVVGDAADILTLLLELAADIPLLVDTLEREEALYALIRNCARAGESWVAVDDDGHVVGCALADRAQQGRHYAEHEVLDLRYAAVTAACAQGETIDELIGKLLGGMVPVTATVSPQNRTGLAECLERLGFRPVGAGGSERRFRWQPG